MSRSGGAVARTEAGRIVQLVRNSFAKRGRNERCSRECAEGMRLAPPPGVSEHLKRRLGEYASGDLGDANFAARLVELTEVIERSFDGDVRHKLLELAEDTFERHLELREHTQRARRDLERLRRDQQRLVEILASLTARPENEPLH